MVAELIMEASNILTERVIHDTTCIQQPLKLFVGSWNVGGITPPHSFNLEKFLNTQDSMADIYVLGFQEIVPLNAGSIWAAENSDISIKWSSLIKAALNKRTPAEDAFHKAETGESQRVHPLTTQSSIKPGGATDYKCIVSKQMVGIYITIWARTELSQYISYPSVSCVGCGILGCLGNKGSVSIRFCLHETSFCFVCSHLASGGKEGDERHRNADAAHILSRTIFPPEPLQHLPRKILDHEVIWLGDLNYRIRLPEETTRSFVKNKDWNLLLQNDQLRAEMSKGHVFEEWHEGLIEFPPTYKYDQNSDDYYGSGHKEKAKRMRAPAWCDRIIWFGKGLKQVHYNRVESRLSDHRPVYGRFIAYVEVSTLPGMN
ncbi:phosphoinositide 5-phosphatase [Salvia divinorum]|uniref:Phosphoinositide 5-phosphatase n=1 Tax=Salvia divinorum TaxID=28513 RepID=A0ABD1GFF9_SALDI